VGDCFRVEDDDVGEISLLQKSATIQLQIGRGQTGQTADRFFERNDLLFADVFAEQPREVSVGARVRRGFQEYALGSHLDVWGYKVLAETTTRKPQELSGRT